MYHYVICQYDSTFLSLGVARCGIHILSMYFSHLEFVTLSVHEIMMIMETKSRLTVKCSRIRLFESYHRLPNASFSKLIQDELGIFRQLVVWNMNYIFPIILGMSSSQLTFSPSFFRGIETTNQIGFEGALDISQCCVWKSCRKKRPWKLPWCDQGTADIPPFRNRTPWQRNEYYTLWL